MRVLRSGIIALSALALAIIGSAIMSDHLRRPIRQARHHVVGPADHRHQARHRRDAADEPDLVVHYTGWLYENGAKGKKFNSSVDRSEPFKFPVGAGRVIAGWDEGVGSMKVGGKRTLIIPPSSAMARAARAAPFRRTRR